MRQNTGRSLRSTAAAVGILAGLSASPALAQELLVDRPVGQFIPTAAAYGISADGSTVVGYARWPMAGGVTADRAFVWTGAGGFDEFTDRVSQAHAVSGDGSVIVGQVRSQDETGVVPFRWTRSGGIVELPLVSGMTSAVAHGVSADGSVIAGHGYGIVAGNLPAAFRWTAETGSQLLAPLAGGNRSEARGVSGDGTTIVGASSSATSGPWMEAVRWTESGDPLALGKINNGDSSYASAASHDGSVITGAAVDGQAGLQRAFRWTEAGGMESLGVLNGGLLSVGYGISPDGTTIVGTATNGAQNNVSRAFRWTEESGMQTVEDWLRDAGADIENDVTWNAYGVSGDGTIVVGETHSYRMFVARATGGGQGGDDGGGAGDGDGAGSGGNGGGSGGGGGPDAGLALVEDLAASLGSSAAAGGAATNSMGLLMNGAGSRPLDRRAPAGKATAWISGDLGRDDHGSRHGDVKLGEVGAGYNFGGFQVNAAFGLAGFDQKTLLGGRTDIDAGYVKLEALAPLYRTGDGGLWLVMTGAGLWGDADFRRNYLVNGGLVDRSAGSANVVGYGARARLQWENLLPHVSPYGEMSYTHVCMGAYTETGGAFPASFDKRCDDFTEARIGLDATLPMTENFRLIGTVEGIHRFEKHGSSVSGQLVGLGGGFTLPGARFQQSWLRGGAGFEVDISASTLSVMANATTSGESANAWIAANWRVNF